MWQAFLLKNDIIANIRLQKIPPKGEITMECVFEKSKADDFFDYLLREEKSLATAEKYKRDVLRFIRFATENNGKADKGTVMKYKDYLGENYEISSANSMLAALNSFLRWSGFPHLTVKRFRMQRESFCSEEGILTREEYFRLVKCANEKGDERLALMLQTICSTGIRVSELKFITLEAARLGEARVYSKGKSRRIFILPTLAKKLSRYARVNKIKRGPLFLARDGAPISRCTVWREMKSLCKIAGVNEKKVFPHNLRHLFARSFLEVEKDVVKLADILGHSNINTTRVYTVSSGAEHRQKMQRMRLIF